MTTVNIVIYYFILYAYSILHLDFFKIEGAKGHTFHYDYTQYDYM